MMVTSGLLAQQSGSFLLSGYRPLISEWKFGRNRFQFVKIPRAPLQCSFPIFRHIKCVPVRANGHQQPFSGDKSGQESFWLTTIKDAAWSLRSLGIFLIEQPSQLKYIEWPSFQSTLKTATLTLVLVALIIVALSSIDSVLCYVLAYLLRRPA